MQVVPPSSSLGTQAAVPPSPGPWPGVIRPRSATPRVPMGFPRRTDFFPSFAAGSAPAPAPEHLPSTSGPASTAGSRTSAFTKYVPPGPALPSLYPPFVEQQHTARAAPGAGRAACRGAASGQQAAGGGAARGQAGAAAAEEGGGGKRGQRGHLGGGLEERTALLQRLSAERAVPTGREGEALANERTRDRPPSPSHARVRKRRRHSVVPQLEGMSAVQPDEELPTPTPPVEPLPLHHAQGRRFPASIPPPQPPPPPPPPHASHHPPSQHPSAPPHEPPPEPVLGIPISAAISFCGPRSRVLGFPCLPGGATSGGHGLPVVMPGNGGGSWLAGAAAAGVGHGMGAAGWGGARWGPAQWAVRRGGARDGWGWGASAEQSGGVMMFEHPARMAAGCAGAAQARPGMHAHAHAHLPPVEEHRPAQAAQRAGGAARVPVGSAPSALQPHWDAATGSWTMVCGGASHLAQPHGSTPAPPAGWSSAAPKGPRPMEWISAHPDCVPAPGPGAATRLPARPTSTPIPTYTPPPTVNARHQSEPPPSPVPRPTLADVQALQQMWRPDFPAAHPPAAAASLSQLPWAALAASAHWGGALPSKPPGVKVPVERSQRGSGGQAGGPWRLGHEEQACADRATGPSRGGQPTLPSDAGLRMKAAAAADRDGGGHACGPVPVAGAAALREWPQELCAPHAPVQLWQGTAPQSPVAVHELCHWKTSSPAAQLPASKHPFGAYAESKIFGRKRHVAANKSPSVLIVGMPWDQQWYLGRRGTLEVPLGDCPKAPTSRAGPRSNSAAVLEVANRAEQVSWSEHEEVGGAGCGSASPGSGHACSQGEERSMMDTNSSSPSARDSHSGRPSAPACEHSHDSEAHSLHVHRPGSGLLAGHRAPSSASLSGSTATGDKADTRGGVKSPDSGAAAREDIENMVCAEGGACPEGEGDAVRSSVTNVHPSQ